MDDLKVGGFSIPSSELEWRFDPSGGPGGQHANRSSTRAELRFDLGESAAFPPEIRDYVLDRLGGRAPRGIVSIVVDESRSQWRNRQAARRAMAALIEEALKRPRSRRVTKPTKAARERRLREKRLRSEKKQLRRSPDDD